MGPGAGCCGPSSGAGGHGSGRQPGPLPSPQPSPGGTPASRHGHAIAWAPSGSRVPLSPSPLPGSHWASRAAEASARPGSRDTIRAWIGSIQPQRQPVAPAEPSTPALLASPLCHGLSAPAPGSSCGGGEAGAQGRWYRGAAATPLGKQLRRGVTRARPHACPRTRAHACMCPHARTHAPMSTRVQALQTSRWRWSDASGFPASPSASQGGRSLPPSSPRHPAGERAMGAGEGQHPQPGLGAPRPTSRLACPGTAPRGTMWWADASETSNRLRRQQGGSAISHCPRGFRHPVSHSWGVPGPTWPMAQLCAPLPAVPGPLCPPAGAGQPCRWVCRPAPGSPRSSKTSRSPKDGWSSKIFSRAPSVYHTVNLGFQQLYDAAGRWGENKMLLCSVRRSLRVPVPPAPLARGLRTNAGSSWGRGTPQTPARGAAGALRW